MSDSLPVIAVKVLESYTNDQGCAHVTGAIMINGDSVFLWEYRTGLEPAVWLVATGDLLQRSEMGTVANHLLVREAQQAQQGLCSQCGK